METFAATLSGVAPLLMHNGQLADPTNKWAKELAKHAKGKAKNLEEARQIEFLGSLCLDEDNRPCVTGDMLYACVIAGARARKQGKAAQAGVYEAAPSFSLKYDGPRDPLALYKDGRFSDYRGVRVGQVRVMRSRPIFRSWSVDISLFFDPTLIEHDTLKLALEHAGLACGLGDYRPRFGRFTVKVRS